MGKGPTGLGFAVFLVLWGALSVAHGTADAADVPVTTASDGAAGTPRWTGCGWWATTRSPKSRFWKKSRPRWGRPCGKTFYVKIFGPCGG